MTTCLGNCCSPAVACSVYGDVFCAVIFPGGVLDEILNLIESVSEGFPSYSYSKAFPQNYIPIGFIVVTCLQVELLLTLDCSMKV